MNQNVSHAKMTPIIHESSLLLSMSSQGVGQCRHSRHPLEWVSLGDHVRDHRFGFDRHNESKLATPGRPILVGVEVGLTTSSFSQHTRTRLHTIKPSSARPSYPRIRDHILALYSYLAQRTSSTI
jgi:hypothetical protein